MHAGAVHRYFYRGQPGVEPRPDAEANLFKHPKVQLDDEPVLFEQRDELVGIDHAFGAHPANQRLCAADGFAFGPVAGRPEIPCSAGLPP